MRLIFPFISLSTVFLLSCHNSQKPSTSVDGTQTIETVESPLVTNEEEAIFHIDTLFKNYAIEDRYAYPYDSLNTKSALLILRHQNPDTLQFYLTYFFTKKYRYHLKNLHISSEIRDNNPKNYLGIDTITDPILYEFFRIYNPFEKKGISLDSLMVKPVEFISSGIILDWLKDNSQYEYYPILRDEIDSLHSVQEYVRNLEWP